MLKDTQVFGQGEIKTIHFAFVYLTETEEHVFFVWCVKGLCVRIWTAPDLKSGLCDFRDPLEMVYFSRFIVARIH